SAVLESAGLGGGSGSTGLPETLVGMIVGIGGAEGAVSGSCVLPLFSSGIRGEEELPGKGLLRPAGFAAGAPSGRSLLDGFRLATCSGSFGTSVVVASGSRSLMLRTAASRPRKAHDTPIPSLVSRVMFRAPLFRICYSLLVICYLPNTS